MRRAARIQHLATGRSQRTLDLQRVARVPLKGARMAPAIAIYRRLAEEGAWARLKGLHDEATEILAHFPQLKGQWPFLSPSEGRDGRGAHHAEGRLGRGETAGLKGRTTERAGADMRTRAGNAQGSRRGWRSIQKNGSSASDLEKGAIAGFVSL